MRARRSVRPSAPRSYGRCASTPPIDIGRSGVTWTRAWARVLIMLVAGAAISEEGVGK